MILQDGHQDVLQRVRRGIREEVERRIRVSRSDSVRMLGGGFGLVTW